MKIGLFDHIEHGERPLSTLFAEHHQTPLNMVPVPGVFLGAVARLTRRMRLGTLVYLLPLYPPLRMIDEICMLDHLSHGRLEVGVGRGVSPFELKYHNVEHEDSRDIFIDAFQCVRAGLLSDELTYSGPYYKYDKVPIALRPLQRPYPAFWYPSSGAEGSAWAGQQGLHFVTLGSMQLAKENIDTFKEAFAKRGRADRPKAEFPGGVAIGVQRHIFVDDTDERARAWAKPAMEVHLKNINWLRTRHGVTGLTTRLKAVRGATFEECIEEGSVIVGSPATVTAEIERHVHELGINYLLTYLFLGTMSLADALRSLQLFSTEVMPKLAKL
jgi:alkanesulfonate monooxygenase SsuD/methylene tetrahydromethanopterin reductase-like flavin-dependent oxidoreductase (luciferase family)